jgi:hypothetical protein
MSIIIIPVAGNSHILHVLSSFFYTEGPEMLFCYVILVCVVDKKLDWKGVLGGVHKTSKRVLHLIFKIGSW